MESPTANSRHLNLVEHDQLRLLRQQPNALNDHQSALVDPKFLGCCCGPALSSCCGCTLQFSLKAFATVALVFGVLGLMGAVASIMMVDAWDSVQSFIRSGLLLALGISLWNTAAEINPRLGHISAYILSGIYTADVVHAVLCVISFTSPKFKSKIVELLVQQFVSREHRDPNPDDMQVIQMLATTAVSVLIGSKISGIVLQGLLFLFVFYFIWSFIVRAKRGEYFLLAYGPLSLPMSVPQVVPPGYGVYYPQPIVSQPVYPPPQQDAQYRTNQVQLADVHSQVQPQTGLQSQ